MFIYALIDPQTKSIRYVGKAKNPSTRFKAHLRDKKISHKASWITSLLRQGLKPEMDIIEEVDDARWREAEVYWIDYYRTAGEPLTNLAVGGLGSAGVYPTEEQRRKMSESRKGKSSWWNIGKHPSEETRKKLSASRKGRKPSLETIIKLRAWVRPETYRKQISERQKGEKNPQWGKPISEATKEKLRLALSGEKNPFWGKKHSEVALAKMRGRKVSDERKKAIGDLRRGKPISDEQRAQISHSLSGRPKSESHRAKMREAALRRWARYHANGDGNG